MSRQTLSSDAPATEFAGGFVTASDTLSFPATRGLMVGTAGVARMIDEGGIDTGPTNLYPLTAGYHPISVTRIYATGLTAANIWKLY